MSAWREQPKASTEMRLAGTRHRQALSGNEIHARGLGLRRFDFLSCLNLVLIGLDRHSVSVGGFVCDELEFRFTDDDMGRICWTNGTHVPSVLECFNFAGIRSRFLKRFG
jgi:hypothetical protein